MDPPAPAAADAFDDEEWELCNDDGFVYKRRKRRRLAGDDAAVSARPPDPEVDPAAEERNRREWKRRILLKLKSKYQREIEQWEILSNSLSATQEKADRFQTRQREQLGNAEKTALFPESSIGEAQGHDKEDASVRPSLLDELLFMAEAQEEMISEVWNLCEVAEEMCRVVEEEGKEPYLDLPIWGSPRDLMTSLCVDKL